MSQYPPPPPYGPQGPLGRQPFDSGKDPLAPARRAALTLWIIGGLLFLGCGCIAAAIWVVPIDQIVAQVRTNMPPGEAQQLQGMNLATVVRAAYTGIGVAGVLVGLVMVLLAFFVFRGGRGAAITALVLTIPMALVCLILIAIAIYQGIHASPQALVAAALWVAILGLVGLLMAFLVQAIRTARPAFGHAQGQQYWQMQQLQNELGPGQGGYGYGAPLPPPPQTEKGWVVPPPPPQPNQSESKPPGA